MQPWWSRCSLRMLRTTVARSTQQGVCNREQSAGILPIRRRSNYAAAASTNFSFLWPTAATQEGFSGNFVSSITNTFIHSRHDRQNVEIQVYQNTFRPPPSPRQLQLKDCVAHF